MNNQVWPLAVEAMSKAYRYRDGLPERTRQSIEVNYYTVRGETDLAEAVLRRRTELNDEG